MKVFQYRNSATGLPEMFLPKEEWGFTPSIYKEGFMDKETTVKKARVAKAPKKIEIARITVQGNDIAKLYKLADQSGFVANYRRARFQEELLNAEGIYVLPGDQVQVDIASTLYPQIVLLRDEPAKVKAARKPREPKADGTVKAPRKPRTPKAE